MKKIQALYHITLSLLVLVPAILCAQAVKTTNKLLIHHEMPDDAYSPNSHQNTKTSPAYSIRGDVFFTTQVNINALGLNILGDAANEPSIAIDPTNPNRMIIGWRQFDDVNNNFRQAGFGYTEDGGDTWIFPGVIDPGIFRSDPVLDSDSDGNFYYNSLTVNGGDYTCDVYKIATGGFNWDAGTFAQGGDKQWMVIDKTDGQGAGNIYSFWTQSWSTCWPGAFTRSINGGASYENCVEVSGDPYWGTMAVGPEGEVYIVGAGYNGVVVVKSTTAQNPGFPVAWDDYYQVSLDGELTGWTQVNPAGLLGQADIDVDISDGSGRGNIYVLSSVERTSNSDPADVMFARSTNGGTTWSNPIRINDDIGNNNYQWFGTMSVAPGGRIDVVWLDTRDDNPGIYWSALYYSSSFDCGETWTTNQKLSIAFDPHVGWPDQEKMGDYFDMRSDDDYAHLAWANTINGEQDVYYGRIPHIYTGTEEISITNNELTLTCYPNPCNSEVTIRYQLNNKSDVKLEICNLQGELINSALNKEQDAGAYNETISVEGLADGIYFCRLQAGEYSKSVRLVVMR
jgi:hypothetical protein